MVDRIGQLARADDGLMPGETRKREVQVKGKTSQTDDPRSKTIQALFEEQAALTPLAVAIEFEDRRLTYGQLNEQANRAACRLRRLGIDRGMLVGICMERSPELIVGLLGILKAGEAYVPLDPDDPDKRRSIMIRDTRTPVIVAHGPTASRLAPSLGQANILWIGSDEPGAGEESGSNPEVGVTARDLAYVMYRSGAAGAPQGVMFEHRSVVHLVRSTNYCRLGSDEVFLQLAPI
jgi:non-ribosomal peptide synthetase component F